MLEVSSLKSRTNKSKEFIFCVELVAPVLPSVSYLFYVIWKLLHRNRLFYPVRIQRLWISLVIKKKYIYLYS